MFTLLLGYMLGVATTYYFEDIFNYNISSVNLKTKLNTVLQNTVYNHIDTFETNNKNSMKQQDCQKIKFMNNWDLY